MSFCVSMRISTITYVFFACAVVATYSAKLPAAFHRCHKSDPNFSECIRAGTEGAIHYLKAGAPELTLSTFDPLEIDELIIGEGTGPVNVQQNFHKVKLHGLTDSKVLLQTADFDKKQLFAISVTPELRLEADYNMKGRVLLLPIFGDGPCNVTLINTKINHTLEAEQFEKKGRTFWKFTKYSVVMRPEKVVFKFDNLFNGDKRLGDEINKVLNDNWDAVFGDVRAGYEKSFGLIFQDLANRVFTRVPVKDIFLE